MRAIRLRRLSDFSALSRRCGVRAQREGKFEASTNSTRSARTSHSNRPGLGQGGLSRRGNGEHEVAQKHNDGGNSVEKCELKRSNPELASPL